MLVVPPDVFLLELFRFLWWWRWVGDLGDKVGRRSLSDAVDEHAKERDLKEDEKGNGKAIKHAGAVVEPEFLLLWTVADAGEVRIELDEGQLPDVSAMENKRVAHQFAHQRSAREVALQEHHQISFGQENTASEDDHSRLPANGLIEGVETGCR